MQYIDEKYKEQSPAKTVETIKAILKGIGVELQEKWFDSGVENCWSLSCSVNGMEPHTNGKGITKEFAQASAYGEFMERLQSGLFFYKFQSIERDEAMNLHTYAPDKKFMTVQELIDNGEWMDYLIEAYGKGLTREEIARQCKIYACTEEDKILTIPFYSLFEDKYVYLPAGFAEHMYSANGCCVGNTRAEAWIHALSEIIERRGSVGTLTSAAAAPEIPEHVLQQFPTVSKILEKIRSYKNLDVKIFDFSRGMGFPVISTRIINKDNQGYIVDTGADPILEIAIQRTLTEIMQGKNIDHITAKSSKRVLNKISDFPVAHNVLNLLESGHGAFTVDFFAEELTCKETWSDFADNSGRTNEELLPFVLEYYKAIKKPVYIRNYSFLNFHCYKIIVPGFSESRAFRLHEKMQEYALADVAAKVLRQPKRASVADLAFLPTFHNSIRTIHSRYNSFSRLAGIPIDAKVGASLLMPTLSYACYRTGDFGGAVKYIDQFLNISWLEKDIKQYFACLKMFLQLKQGNHAEEKIRLVLSKFFPDEIVTKLFTYNTENQTPYDPYLLDCDPGKCEGCAYKEKCAYNQCKDILFAAGQRYAAFTDGQNREVFAVN